MNEIKDSQYLFLCSFQLHQTQYGILRGVFAAYFTLLHIAGHKPLDTKQKAKRRMEVKLKHMSQPATREVSVFIGAFFEQTCFSN